MWKAGFVWGGRYGIYAFISEERRDLEEAKLHDVRASFEETEEAYKTHKTFMNQRLERIIANQANSKKKKKLKKQGGGELFAKEERELN